MPEPTVTFRLIEFNPRRKMRGAEAARVEVTENGETYWLWMSVKDIKNNIREFGDCEELQKALDAYKGKVVSDDTSRTV